MASTVFYSEARDRNYSTDELDALSLTELKDLFNEEASSTAVNPTMFKPISKFSDKKNAIRRVIAILTEDTEDTEDTVTYVDQFGTTATVTKEEHDPRMQQVTCATCLHTDAKHTMTLVGGAWYCMDEDACELRLNPVQTQPASFKDKVKAASAAASSPKVKRDRGTLNTEPKGPTNRRMVLDYINGKPSFTVKEIAELLGTNMNNASTTINLLFSRPAKGTPAPAFEKAAKGEYKAIIAN